MKDDDTSLRLVAENLKLEISTLNQELINKQAEFSSSETSLRNEVKEYVVSLTHPLPPPPQQKNTVGLKPR